MRVVRLIPLSSLAFVLTTAISSALPGCGAPETSSPEALPAQAAESALPGDSIYHLQVPLIDWRGEPIGLDAWRGSPTLISMFYTTCPSACPMLIADLQAIEDELTDGERDRLRVLLVSLTPEADTPEAMRGVVQTHGLDAARWTLSAPPPERVRDVAAALGISYRDAGGGHINHSTIITLLGPDGEPLARLDGLGQDPAPLVQALRALEARPGGS